MSAAASAAAAATALVSSPTTAGSTSPTYQGGSGSGSGSGSGHHHSLYNPYSPLNDVGGATTTTTTTTSSTGTTTTTSAATAADGELSLMDLLAKDVADLAEKFKLEDGEERHVSNFSNIEKSKVLQEARVLFNDMILIRDNPGKCCKVMTQLLHLHYTLNEPLTKTEVTDVFFDVTKLFMSDDPALRRMVYLFLKEMSDFVDRSDVIIVTSCLTKDMTCDVDLYRANALRVLARVVDGTLLGAIERYVRQALVDPSNLVSMSALISASKWYASNDGDCVSIVKKWIREVTNVVTNSNADDMIQYQALLLLYQIKSKDRLGVSKLVTQLSNAKLSSALANVMLVRYTQRIIIDEYRHGGKDINTSTLSQHGFNYLISCLRFGDDMVMYEASRAICSLPRALVDDNQLLSQSVLVLRKLLSGTSGPAAKYASVRILSNIVAIHYPRIVGSKCNEELENLISDHNRSVGTMAIKCLLRTCNENNIERLLRQICIFVIDIADEYKVWIVNGIIDLCILYPKKQYSIVAFLANFLREEGGYEFKSSIVHGMLKLVDLLPESKENVLFHLCEFIEDCEYVSLSTQILFVLAEVGCTTNKPSRFIRFIYNRVMLENAPIRAAAVSTLVKFACAIPSLRESIVQLLKRSLADEDDETRDRASLAMAVLKEAMEVHPYIQHHPANDDDEDENDDAIHVQEQDEQQPLDKPSDDDCAAYLYLQPFPNNINFHTLEKCVLEYASCKDAMESEEKITFDTLPIPTLAEEHQHQIETDDAGAGVSSLTIPHSPTRLGIVENGISSSSSPTKKSSIIDATSTTTLDSTHEDQGNMDFITSQIYSIPELASLGTVFKTCTPAIDLTESETEYVVNCIKHVFFHNNDGTTVVVLQFNVTNTVEECKLRDVTVSLDCKDFHYAAAVAANSSGVISAATESPFEVTGEIPADEIEYGSEKSCFTIIQHKPTTPRHQSQNDEQDDDDHPTNSSPTLSLPPSCATFLCEMHFNLIQVDPITGEEFGDDAGYSEEYPLENIHLTTCDYISKRIQQRPEQTLQSIYSPPQIIQFDNNNILDFRKTWEQLGNTNEVYEKYVLQKPKYNNNLDYAINDIIQHLGMNPCDGTGSIVRFSSSSSSYQQHTHGLADRHAGPAAAGKKNKSHLLHLSGMFLGGYLILVRSQVSLTTTDTPVLGDEENGTHGGAGAAGVILKIAVRSQNKSLSRLVADSIS